MTLVSGRWSSLNPNAPLFIPAALRQIEDFSPEWWELVTTSTWFREYWLNERCCEEEINGEEDIYGSFEELLPDNLDDISSTCNGFEQSGNGLQEKGLEVRGGLAMMRKLEMVKKGSEWSNGGRGSKGGGWLGKAAQIVSPRCSPRRIQQPR